MPPVVFLVGQGLVAGLTINAVAALGEELGWCGYLLPALQETYSPFTAGLLVGVSLIAVGANTLRSVNTPMGYVIEVLQAPWYGAVWGTGSLAIGAGGRIAPSLAVLVERSGPMEITAFVAIVVARRGVMLWHQESVPRWKEDFVRVRSPSDWSLTRREWALLVGGYPLLAIACYREGVAIAQVTE